MTTLSPHDYAAALDAGRTAQDTEFRATAVRYHADRDLLEITTAAGCGFLLPRAWIAAFDGLAPADLAALEVWPDGSALEIEPLDIQVSVHGLLTACLPAMLPPGALSTVFASRGGQTRSPAKQAAARANGHKGGRPRKVATTDHSGRPT